MSLHGKRSAVMIKPDHVSKTDGADVAALDDVSVEGGMQDKTDRLPCGGGRCGTSTRCCA